MVDMHIHTKNSDGEKTVAEIIKMLEENNINIFSITDHDNIDSCFELEQINLPENMLYIPGIEFSATLDKYKCHILGYNINYHDSGIIKECQNIRNRRYQKILKIIENLWNNFGIEISKEEKLALLNKHGSLSRTDLCRILLKRGYGSKTEIFDKYLVSPKNNDHRSEANNIINIIHAAGGKAILAHPKEIETDYAMAFEDIIKNFLEIGIDGIEIYNSIHEDNDVKRYLELAKKNDLLKTGGSDYHGKVIKPNVEIGYTTKSKIKIYQADIKFPK